MHILLIHQVFLSAGEAGGTRHFEFAQRCVKEGNQFTVVASDVSYLDGKKKNVALDERVNGVRVLRAHMPGGLHQSFVRRVFSFIYFMLSSVRVALSAGPVDVVMGTSPPLFQALSAWFVARIRSAPFLLEIRDLWPDFAIDMGILKNRFVIMAARAVENFLYRASDHILVNSPAYRDFLIGRGLRPQKITLISNGVDASMFDPEERGQSLRDELRLDGKFVVTYAGALGPANDIPTIVRAAERLQDDPTIHFLLVGDGKDRVAVQRMIADKQLPNITIAGPRPKSDMNRVLGASDVCTATLMNIPMFAMTYPNKVFDYMAAGRPIVLAIDGVIRKVVEDADAGFFAHPGNDAEFANRVRTLRHDPLRCREMGQRGRQYVIDHFNRAQQATAFLKLLRTLAAGQIVRDLG